MQPHIHRPVIFELIAKAVTDSGKHLCCGCVTVFKLHSKIIRPSRNTQCASAVVAYDFVHALVAGGALIACALMH